METPHLPSDDRASGLEYGIREKTRAPSRKPVDFSGLAVASDPIGVLGGGRTRELLLSRHHCLPVTDSCRMSVEKPSAHQHNATINHRQQTTTPPPCVTVLQPQYDKFETPCSS